MQQENILLYKTLKAFYRFIKGSYLENFNVLDYNRFNIEDSKRDNHLLAFISIENAEDLVVFASIYSKVEKIYVISYKDDINGMLVKLCEDVTIIPKDMLRPEIIKEIENSLRLLKAS